MDEQVQRLLARATELPDAVQVMIWEGGDSFARANLAGLSNLLPALQAQMAAGDDLRVLAAWARRTRPDADLLLAAASRPDLDEHAMMALAGQAALPEEGLRALAPRATDAVGCRLLDRDDLPNDVRRVLVPRYVTTLDGSPTGKGTLPMTPATRTRLGDDPATWQLALATAGTRQALLLGHVPCLDDAGVQRALVAAVTRVLSDPQGMAGRGSRDACLRALRNLLRCPRIDAQAWASMRALAGSLVPELGDAMRRRTDADFSALSDACVCSPFGAVDDDPSHAEALRTLVDAAERVVVPGARLVVSALAHADALGDDVVAQALGRLRGDEMAQALAAVEQAAGGDPRGPQLLARMVRMLHTGVLEHLADPEPVVRLLAGAGWSALVTGVGLPEQARAWVLEDFCPVVDLLPDSWFAALVAAEVSNLPAGERDAAWALLGEWVGSFGQLRQAVALM